MTVPSRIPSSLARERKASRISFNNKVQVLYYRPNQDIEMIRERTMIDSIAISNTNFEEFQWVSNNDLVKKEPFISLNSLKAINETEMNVKGGELEGEVIVSNLALEKKVTIRYSFDGWKSWKDLDAIYHRSMIALRVDRFTFKIPAPSLKMISSLSSTLSLYPSSSSPSPSSLSLCLKEGTRWKDKMGLIGIMEEMDIKGDGRLSLTERMAELEFACRYECGKNVWWDNNKSQNYKIELIIKYEDAQRLGNLKEDNDNSNCIYNHNCTDSCNNDVKGIEKRDNGNLGSIITIVNDIEKEEEWTIVKNATSLTIPKLILDDQLCLSSSPPITARS